MVAGAERIVTGAGWIWQILWRGGGGFPPCPPCSLCPLWFPCGCCAILSDKLESELDELDASNSESESESESEELDGLSLSGSVDELDGSSEGSEGIAVEVSGLFLRLTGL